MKVSGKVQGGSSLGRAIQSFTDGVEKVLADAVVKAGYRIQKEAIQSISQGPSRSGVEVKRGGKTHVRSAPGEAPATDTGFLVRSINVSTFEEKDGRIVGARVGSKLKYARDLEFGTSKMAARPWLQPAFEKTKKANKTSIERALREARIAQKASKAGGDK